MNRQLDRCGIVLIESNDIKRYAFKLKVLTQSLADRLIIQMILFWLKSLERISSKNLS